MPDDIYWQDSLIWSEQQSALLQRLADGERVNAEIDWEHVIEEVRDVGMSEFRAVSSLLTRGLEHLLKLQGWPDAQAVNHWQVEAVTFLLDAQSACSPSIRGRVDLANAYRRASQSIARMRVDGTPSDPLPITCPFELVELLPMDNGSPDIDALVAKLSIVDSHA